jgi:UDP-N-acetylglucosamine:LPS N-acetylglucosamine transferase
VNKTVGELAGQTVVVIGGSAGIGLINTAVTGAITSMAVNS